jgi:hypothetical protein
MNEYLAQNHSQAMAVLNLRDEWNGDNGNWIRRKANTLIREYPDLIAAYNLRYDVLGYETSIVAQAKESPTGI